jgi:hypothetical protein
MEYNYTFIKKDQFITVSDTGTDSHDQAVEINLHKLLNTTGLTRKRVLVRRKGEAPFWSTRWVQTGDTVKETVEAAGFELVAVEGEEPEIVDINTLIKEAIDAGKAAFEAGITMREPKDPVLDEIIGRSDGNVKNELSIREGWAKGWNAANVVAPVPGVLDEPEPEDKGIVSFELIKPAFEAGKAAFLNNEANSTLTSPSLAAVVREGNHTVATLEQLSMAWRRGWQDQSSRTVVPDNFDTMPDGEPEPINLKVLVDSAKEAGKVAFLSGLSMVSGVDPKLMDIVKSGDGKEETSRVLSQAWIMGWDSASRDAPSVLLGSQDDRPVSERDIPLADRIDRKSRMKVPGIGTTPAITVGNVQIGDRLQFPDGVFRVKDIVVKGKSSTLIFEETDDDGKKLQLKKQNRAWMAVEKTQLTPGGYVPKPNKPGVPYWGRQKEVESGHEREVSVSSSVGFTPVKSVVEGIERLQRDFIKTTGDTTSIIKKFGVNLDGLKLSGVNSIIKGFDKVLGKHDIKIDYIGWNPRKQSGVAYYAPSYGDYKAIKFQKTATKNINSRKSRSTRNFDINKEANIAKHERYLTYKEVSPGSHNRDRHDIALLKACTRWTVDVSLDDMLAGTAAHEANHAVYHVHKLKAAWEHNLTYLVGDKMNKEVKCASVSEYGMSSMGELFAEVGTAVAFDIPIDPDVKQAYLDTIGSIKNVN